MGWRSRFRVSLPLRRTIHSALRFEKEHRRELVSATILAALFAVAAAVAVEVVRPWWLNRQRDEATQRIRNATATLVSRDKNNQATAVGIGIFISPDGTLITNRHVVTGGELVARRHRAGSPGRHRQQSGIPVLINSLSQPPQRTGPSGVNHGNRCAGLRAGS